MTRPYNNRKTCCVCKKRKPESDFYKKQNKCKVCQKIYQTERRRKIRRLGLKPGFKKAQMPDYIPDPDKHEKFNAFDIVSGLPARNNPCKAKMKVGRDYLLATDRVGLTRKFRFDSWRFVPMKKAV